VVFTVAIEGDPDPATRQLIDEGLDLFNESAAGAELGRDLWVIARDADQRPVGGLKARTSYNWLFIDWLWISTCARGQGLGRRLLAVAEHRGQEMGCTGAYVDTFSFQAPEFYRRSGYEEFGRIADFPPGHQCIWLKKVFARD